MPSLSFPADQVEFEPKLHKKTEFLFVLFKRNSVFLISDFYKNHYPLFTIFFIHFFKFKILHPFFVFTNGEISYNRNNKCA